MCCGKEALSLRPPRRDGTFGLSTLTEDQPKEHVETPNCEEEERGYESEVIDVV